MKNSEQLRLALHELRADCGKRQKRGLHFIIASVFIWTAVLLIHISDLPILDKNLYTFFCSAPLVPLAYFISKLIGIDFKSRENPLSNLGLLFTLNQLLYILIAMWAYSAVPEKMLMVYAMIFGAHLLPFGWLYRSRAYYVFSIIVTAAVFILGLCFSAAAVAIFMVINEAVLSVCLIAENLREERLS